MGIISSLREGRGGKKKAPNQRSEHLIIITTHLDERTTTVRFASEQE